MDQKHRSNIDKRYPDPVAVQYICGSIVTKPVTLFRANGLSPKTLQNVYIICPSIFSKEIEIFENTSRKLTFPTLHNGCGVFVKKPWKSCALRIQGSSLRTMPFPP